MSKWDKPKKLSNMDVGFGPDRNAGGIDSVLPKWSEIPEEFKALGGSGSGGARKYVKMCDDMFFKSLEVTKCVMKDGIERKDAQRHVRCILHSFEPQHEHKIAGAAYLMSKWFEVFEYKEMEIEKEKV